MTPEKPVSEEDLAKEEDATDAAKKELRLPAKGDEHGSSGNRESPVAESGDNSSAHEPSPSGSIGGGDVEKVDSSGLRYRGFQTHRYKS